MELSVGIKCRGSILFDKFDWYKSSHRDLTVLRIADKMRRKVLTRIAQALRRRKPPNPPEAEVRCNGQPTVQELAHEQMTRVGLRSTATDDLGAPSLAAYQRRCELRRNPVMSLDPRTEIACGGGQSVVE